MNSDRPQLAILIDADNAHPDTLADIMERIEALGAPTVRRIYGDFTSPTLKRWKDLLPTYSLTPVQAFNYASGKNSTDSSMIIDCMDLLYQKGLDGFCIVSSDSDFTRLASRIREDGLLVYGFGRQDTPKAFVKACTSFEYFEFRRDKGKKPPMRHRASQEALRKNHELIKLMDQAICESSGDRDVASMANIGSRLAALSPGFTSRLYGYKKTIDLIRAIGLYEVFEVRSNSTNGRDFFVGASGKKIRKGKVPADLKLVQSC